MRHSYHCVTPGLLGLTVVALSALALSHTVRAQVADVAAAQAVGTAFLKAKHAGDFKAAASFLDLAPLEQYRRSAVEGARRQQVMPPVTVEEYKRHDPDMPRAAAEYQVKRINELRQRQPNYLEQEFGVADPDSLLALPMHVVGERWLQVHDERWLYRETLRMSNCAQLASDTLGPPLPPERVVGTIVDDSLAYVLYEPQDANRETDVMYRRPPSVLQLHRERGSWWVLVGANSSGALMGVSCNRVPNTRKP